MNDEIVITPRVINRMIVEAYKDGYADGAMEAARELSSLQREKDTTGEQPSGSPEKSREDPKCVRGERAVPRPSPGPAGSIVG
jgi:hypothetical protein